MVRICFKRSFFSRKILEHLAPFFTEGFLRKTESGADIFVGWGRKKSFKIAHRLASQNKKPVWSLEDGFLRGLAPAYITPTLLSLIVDKTGIYFDATHPSDLENILNNDAYDANLLNRAKKGIDMMRIKKLSKYNNAHEKCPNTIGIQKGAILVVDQTEGDCSVTYGLASHQSFKQMIDDAVHQNPGRQVVVKVHPDVISGKKEGYLLKYAQQHKCHIISDLINPWSLFKACSKVYVVTSLMGFEALLAEKEVYCYGMPFYAGWGLTKDIQKCPRRTKKRTLQEVFAAAYIVYPRYVNPYTQKISTFEDIVDILGLWKDINNKNRCNGYIASGIGRWKQKAYQHFLFSTENPKVFFKHDPLVASKKALESNKTLVSWASKIPKEFDPKLKKDQHLYTEDGFIRSVGLGVTLTPPCSIAVDACGIYYDARTPSDLENILSHHIFTDAEIERAENLRSHIIALDITKYNPMDTRNLTLPKNKKIILVPGQVESDASIKTGTIGISTNLDLLVAVRKENPDAFILYKPHPDIAHGRIGHIPEEQVYLYADMLLISGNMAKIILMCDEIHTMTSLTGFEGLIRGKKVTCYGMPFYSGWGLTIDRMKNVRRNRVLTIPQLVFGSIVLYPRYIDPVTGLWCTPEFLLTRISDMKQQGDNTYSIYSIFYAILKKFKMKCYDRKK